MNIIRNHQQQQHWVLEPKKKKPKPISKSKNWIYNNFHVSLQWKRECTHTLPIKQKYKWIEMDTILMISLYKWKRYDSFSTSSPTAMNVHVISDRSNLFPTHTHFVCKLTQIIVNFIWIEFEIKAFIATKFVHVVH